MSKNVLRLQKYSMEKTSVIRSPGTEGGSKGSIGCSSPPRKTEKAEEEKETGRQKKTAFARRLVSPFSTISGLECWANGAFRPRQVRGNSKTLQISTGKRPEGEETDLFLWCECFFFLFPNGFWLRSAVIRSFCDNACRKVCGTSLVHFNG